MNKTLFIFIEDVLISSSKYGADDEVTNFKFNEGIIKTINSALIDNYRICIILDNNPKLFESSFSSNLLIRKLSIIKQRLNSFIKGLGTKLDFIINNNTDNEKLIIPKPFSIYTYAVEYNIYLRDSIMIGCNDKHMDTAYNSGINTYIDIIEIINIP